MPKPTDRPSDRWSKTNKFLNAQGDMFRSEHNRALIERIADLSPEQQRRLIVAAPAFVAGEGLR